MKPTWPAAVARRVGLSGAIDFTPTRVGLTIHVPCEKGQHTVDVRMEPGVNPDAVVKRMLAMGWTVGSKPTCPACSKTRRPKEEGPMPAVSTKSAQAPMQPSPTMFKAQRVVCTALEEHFDEKAGAYRAGHTDATIAKEAGCSEVYVKQFRENAFGKLHEPQELTEIRNGLSDVRTEASL
ncbi:hypothetical protein [Novosphingobium sp. FKTRR1]|uniref:hypothetical protein n=1 Tax=Novosphingobium sp. FKTRR1 TaxID=2879118 RepID=UPI001CF00350|nr:hypothetical protein [Novosphingobium sp. FKTRR1]